MDFGIATREWAAGIGTCGASGEGDIGADGRQRER